ncbi:unnamed protein product [Caenorhabditis auriculariae]|uniref:RING-type domain-containing protein n=1 Tax=Caenorhabditis auriculariae TaxID=2777116 RepID=A0A8S1HW28_9PELO|nr:unnamed protein product [Caenorhabditis auriculariae]
MIHRSEASKAKDRKRAAALGPNTASKRFCDFEEKVKKRGTPFTDGLFQKTTVEKAFASASPPVDPCTCPICMRTYSEPYMTYCGHTFCYECIQSALELKKECPTCGAAVSNHRANESGVPGLIPNFAMTKVAEHVVTSTRVLNSIKFKMRINPEKKEDFVKLLLHTDLSEETTAELLTALKQKHEYSQDLQRRIMTKVMGKFISDLSMYKQNIKSFTDMCIDYLRKDAELLNQNVPGQRIPPGNALEPSIVPNPEEVDDVHAFRGPHHGMSTSSTLELLAGGLVESLVTAEDESPMMLERKYALRAVRNFEGLKTAYESIRMRGKWAYDNDAVAPAKLPSFADTLPRGPSPERTYNQNERFDAFSKFFNNVIKYGGAHKVAKLQYDVEPHYGMSIVSSLEFNCDGDQFVVAGVTRKIKVFDFNAVLSNTDRLHLPVNQLVCSSKISSVCWNPYHRNILACTDYEGVVSLWDIRGSSPKRKFHEHGKRCWSVAFNNMDPNVLASGSDDSKVKIWSTNCADSVITIDGRVNVCCVAWSPSSSYELVFGSADHAVHHYDIRQPSRPLQRLVGHTKAVSYVRYLNDHEVVSASTDNTLRLWDLPGRQCTKIMRGHTNEKNFVGLSSCGDHIVCGSENNKAYFYCKDYSRPLFVFDMYLDFSASPKVFVDDPGYDLSPFINSSLITGPPDRSTIVQEHDSLVDEIDTTATEMPMQPTTAAEDPRLPRQVVVIESDGAAGSGARANSESPIYSVDSTAPPAGSYAANVSTTLMSLLPPPPQPQSSRSTASGSGRVVTIPPENKGFVSSVCWRPKSNTILVANSIGKVLILRAN